MIKTILTALFGAIASAISDQVSAYRRDGALKSAGYTQAALDRSNALALVRIAAAKIDAAPFDADIHSVINSL